MAPSAGFTTPVRLNEFTPLEKLRPAAYKYPILNPLYVIAKVTLPTPCRAKIEGLKNIDEQFTLIEVAFDPETSKNPI